MTKSDYIVNKQEIEDHIRDLRKKLKSLESEYIESNRVFKDGEKVRVTNTSNGKEKFAFVYGYEIRFNAKLKPKLKKCKKDGTMSKVDHFLYYTEIVSSIK
jgi:CRISPR/Cas system-associated endonuclease/helicase Cas3